MKDLNFRTGDAKTSIFGSDEMLKPSPVDRIPDAPTTPEIAYQMVKDETFAQTQPRLLFRGLYVGRSCSLASMAQKTSGRRKTDR